MMSFPRATGILLHPTSFPSRGGIGDFGPAAYEFADFLASARQGLWQVLPLGPPANGNSPYSSTSAFAGNPLLISLERLAERGWIGSVATGQPSARSWRNRLRRGLPAQAAADRRRLPGPFFRTPGAAPAHRFERFCAGELPGGWKTLSCSTRCANATTGDAGRSGRATWPAARLRPWPRPARSWLPRWTSAA